LYYDPETQLNYAWHRYYDGTAGRWLSEDPIGFDGGATGLAEYVGNGPTYATDPTGLAEEGVVRDPQGRRLLSNQEHQRITVLRDKFNSLVANVNGTTYTHAEAITDFIHYMINDRKADYFYRWDNDEDKFCYDLGWVLGGVDAGGMGQEDWRAQRTDTRYMGNVAHTNNFSGFDPACDDQDNTIRHIFTMLAFAYIYGDTLGNVAGWQRDPGPSAAAARDREAAYRAADLGEELDDVNDPSGWDLDDFDKGFADYFADPAAKKRLNAKYGWGLK
jgi:RHS repeat-associated protein